MSMVSQLFLFAVRGVILALSRVSEEHFRLSIHFRELFDDLFLLKKVLLGGLTDIKLPNLDLD